MFVHRLNYGYPTIDKLSNDLTLLREKQSAATSFKARAKWFDLDEKSNKYFLNLNKKYSKKKIIDKIVCDGVTHNGQNGVIGAIRGFYKNLYYSVYMTKKFISEQNGLFHRVFFIFSVLTLLPELINNQ